MVADGAEGSELKDAGDLAAHQFIMEVLTAERPDDAVLSEEGADKLERLNAARTWIVDPLDCLLYTSPSPRDATLSRMPSSA